MQLCTCDLFGFSKQIEKLEHKLEKRKKKWRKKKTALSDELQEAKEEIKATTAALASAKQERDEAVEKYDNLKNTKEGGPVKVT